MESWLYRIETFLISIGCEEKNRPNTVSSARVIAYLWALTVIAYALILPAVAGVQAQLPMLTALIAGTCTALGLRSKRKQS